MIGSKVQFDVTTTNKVVTAKIKLLEAGQDIELKPIEIVDDGGMRTAYRCTFTITRSDRYQVVLLGEDGLHNPRPDTYHIVATPDHPPIGKILAPLDDGLNVSLPDGIVPVRISARDDYGLTDITMTLQAPDGKEPLVRQLFTPNPIGHPTGEPVKRQIVLTFLDLAQAEFKEHAQIGGALVLSGSLSDNREPEANTKSIGPRLIRIVGETDLLRLISSHFRRIRDNVDQNYKLILDRNDRLEKVVDRRHMDHIVGQFGGARVSFAHDRDDRPAAGFDLF